MRFALLALAALSLASAASAQQTLAVGDPIGRTLAADGADAYTLDLPAGQFVLGAADQISVDVEVTLAGPDGETIRTFDQPARGPEPFQFTTSAAGIYTLTVTPYGGETGDYTMRLDRSEPAATTPAGIVAQRFAALDNDQSPGAVVAVLQRGEVIFAEAYGQADLTHGVPFTVDTPTNIASTSKQFTAFAVARLAEQGRLSLDDDVRTYIPELPDLGATVTLRHLLTHTSGYREYTTTLSMAGINIDTDLVDRDDVVGAVVRQTALQNAPGAERSYNNTGYGLLALVVERVTETPFQDWMQAEVFGPLGMDDTVVRASMTQIVPGRAAGYVADGAGWKEVTDIGGAMGDGGIYTTAGDLLRWMDTYRTASLGGPDVLRAMTTEAVTTTGDSTGYGLGLFLGEWRGQRRISHGGDDIGHHARFSYFPEIEAGVIVLTNSLARPLTELGVAALFFPDAFPAPGAAAPPADDSVAAYDASTFDPAAFDAFAGRYEPDDSPGQVYSFRRDGDRYLLKFPTGSEVGIVPVGPSEFEMEAGPLAFTFRPAAGGQPGGVTIRQGTRTFEAAQIAPEPEPVVVDDYVGLYYSPELAVVYTIETNGDDLVLTHPRLDAPIPLRQGSAGRFAGGYPFNGVEFERGADGAVTGFVGQGPRTDGVRFEKLRR